MKASYVKALFLGILSLFFIACENQEQVQNDFLFDEYQKGDEITLQSVNGGSKTLVRTQNGFVIKGEEEKIVMLDFFGTFCAPCKEEASHLTQLWKNNAKNFVLIGLTHFESVSDEAVRQFAHDFGAFYFLSNSDQNARIIAQALKDINYQNMEQLPFKVVLQNGEYQDLSDYYNNAKSVKFYLGKVPTELMQEDLNTIKEKNAKN
ncbi:thioredoxin [Campylobacter sp. MIT 12-8780]|uniref:TlpA disulfide reductase family protein n=1 Tax=unclassified Campylobacter TaxID=2593542 RepID=UPI00115EF33E|nr:MULTISPECIES: TlpA disulfide reductase family protein [unclassified Campylobacter]NDJ26643.1 TlpA family protein disulfide reductase [Campylobacter sp. MIT 19-121]TQR42528.1 thioredoxin [Campylobacter sp. MIT 12-8780]